MADKVPVDSDALFQILQAFSGPPHLIREIQFTRNLPGSTNPIDVLITDYNTWVEEQNKLNTDKEIPA